MSGSEGADSLRDCVGEVHLIVTGRFAVQASAEEEIPRRSYRLVGFEFASITEKSILVCPQMLKAIQRQESNMQGAKLAEVLRQRI